MMKKYGVTFLVMVMALVVSTGQVKAEPTNFTAPAPFAWNNFDQNLFETAAQARYKLKITNKAEWMVTEVYVEQSESDDWGNDWLGDNVLGMNDTLTITNLPPGEYDVKFVDEDEDECILSSYPVYKDTYWTLTSEWLAQCEGY